jgi:hypothetical protein
MDTAAPDLSSYPSCRACGAGELVPLSDYGAQGSSVAFKAWVCTNPECGYNLKIRNGDVLRNQPVADAAVEFHAPPARRIGGLRRAR